MLCSIVWRRCLQRTTTRFQLVRSWVVHDALPTQGRLASLPTTHLLAVAGDGLNLAVRGA